MANVESDETDRYDELVKSLSANLVPVAPLRPPVIRALWWFAAAVAAAAVLAPFSDLIATAERLKSVPDLWLASVGSILTAALAAIAAFQLSFPDRSPKWALLPIPALLLWVGASGLGCLRTWLVPGTHDASLAEAKTCFIFILGLSIPLSVLLVAMLRQAHSLWPNLTCALGGLAVAGASATVLNLFHPYDAAATDFGRARCSCFDCHCGKLDIRWSARRSQIPAKFRSERAAPGRHLTIGSRHL
jgi:hypothetical protein